MPTTLPVRRHDTTYCTRSGSGSSGWMRRISANKGISTSETYSRLALETRPPAGARLLAGVKSTHAHGFYPHALTTHCTESAERAGQGIACRIRPCLQNGTGTYRHRG